MKLGSSDYFRKHKKWIFALLTLVAMFVFIVGDSVMARGGGPGGPSTGSRIQTWLYGEEDAFLTVGGKALGPQSIGRLLLDRQSALSFIGSVEQAGWMMEAQSLGFTEADAALFAQIRRVSPFQMGQFLNQPWAQSLNRKIEQLRRDNPDGLSELISNPSALCSQVMQNLYGDPLSAQGAAEFLYWRERADQLGIYLPSAKVKADLLAAGRGRLSEADLIAFLRESRLHYKLDELVDHIGDEIRVMIARSVVMGSSKSSRAMAFYGQMLGNSGVTQATPYDMWRGYVELRTQLEVGILPIKVFTKEFVDAVPTPSIEQLQALYQKYKDQFPDDSLETPGFKIPRKFRIEFVHANLRETMESRKHYDRLVLALEQLDPIAHYAAVHAAYQNRIADFTFQEDAIDMPVGTGAGWARTQAGVGRAVDRLLAAQAIATFAVQLGEGTGVALLPFLPLTQPLIRAVPEAEAAALDAAETLGHALTMALGAPLWVPIARQPRLVTIHRVTSFDEVLARVEYDVRENKVRELVGHDLDLLKKDMQAYGKRYTDARNRFRQARRPVGAVFEPPLFDETEKITLEAHVEKFCKERGFTYAGMKEARPKSTLLVEEPGGPLASYLKPLFVPRLASQTVEQQNENMAESLTMAEKVFEWREILPDLTGDKWLEIAVFWQAERTDERVPTFDECEDQVRQAWFLDQARGPAHEFAEKLAAEVRKAPDGYRLLMDKRGYQGRQLLERFELGATGMSYQPAKVPVIDQPVADFVQQAKKQLHQPGDVMVAWNKPRTHVYVIHLIERREPNPADAKAREEFDFKIMVPDSSRQLLVGGFPFPMWVEREKARDQEEHWSRHIRAQLNFNEEVAARVKDKLAAWVRSGNE
ncbi:MAG TPA: hypothetical protein PKD86_01865 [Gemmatales bacterium]|nr:hypothetical protein [Gemmatales bacterium]HMP58074.1 hypothetical protein [Gemmatales bacterium]